MTTRILYVDDEPDIRLIAQLALNLKPDFEVRMADSGESALAMLADQSWRPDLAMIDVMMPGLTGPEVLARMRADRDLSDLPVVFVTARARQQDVDAYMAQGARGVITKPFDPIGLASQVEALLD